MLSEHMVRVCGSMADCTHCLRRDCSQRLGPGTHADPVMDRIIHNTIWSATGNYHVGKGIGAVQQVRIRWKSAAPTQAVSGRQLQ
ncbi:hypothetical protein GCM10009715_30200 [Paeniglutamicibacter psychrophenolicus]|uniref:Uncharacterized protein n=1 Tax=Paeniglutamicibacter psychrophenolicus TaxID=257454 RepID=A0ABS4W8T1_9MICC|nr:hypothetical protein [Paeniglutamicibacter psychrophenolicus]MBP2372605.1 hypothetical protein [Paeniglutamicibacter psychrophenolicus]